MTIAQALAFRARSDIEVFAEFVLRDERTGNPGTLAAHHRAMLNSWRTRSRTVSLAPSEFAKSTMLAIFIAWRLGNDPSLRFGLLSATREQAVRLLRLVAITMSSPPFALVFPDRGIERSTLDELTVSGRPPTMKDVNVLAGAFDLSSMLGSRFDVACCDDVVSRDDVKTQAARDVAFQGFLAVTASRIAPGGAIHVVNTAEHSDDLPHRLARLPGWHFARFPALDEHGNPTWPERWPLARIEEKRELGPIGFRRAMLCEAIDASALVFTPEQIEAAIKRGSEPHMDPAGGRVVIGVDPAWSTAASSDESGLVMVTVDDAGFRYVVHVEGLRVHHDRLADRVVELARANKATVYVESNGAGGVIADIIGRRAPCKPLATTATSKRARVEAFSAELSSGRWVFRDPLAPERRSPEVAKLCEELVTFSFESHMGDRCSALLLACEGVRTLEAKPKARWVDFNPLLK